MTKVENVENVENVDENVENIGSTIFLVESFLEQNYEFRRNLLNGKTEFAILRKRKAMTSRKRKASTRLRLSGTSLPRKI